LSGKNAKMQNRNKAKKHTAIKPALQGLARGRARQPTGNTNNSQTRTSSQNRQNNTKQPDPNSPFAVLAALKKG
jgi:hypothetical protein